MRNSATSDRRNWTSRLEVEDLFDPLEVEALAGQRLDEGEALDVFLAVAPRPSRGPIRIDQTFALVDPQRLGVHAGKLGRDRDHKNSAALRRSRCSIIAAP